MKTTSGVLLFSALLLFASCSGSPHVGDPFSDAPESAHTASIAFKAADSFEDALQVWGTPEDINAWIAANFVYDQHRALRLAEAQQTKDERMSIYSPKEFFNTKTGVCVDLARFAFETLKWIDPTSAPKYIMIEFDPLVIAGHMLRRHWLVSYERCGRKFFFADSKRPGHIAGPYDSVAAFIDDYARYRGRRIVSYRELKSYRRQQRMEAPQPNGQGNKEGRPVFSPSELLAFCGKQPARPLT